MPEKSRGGWGKWVLIVVVLALIAGGYYYFHRSRAEQLSYNTTAVARGEITQTVTATGTLNPVVNVTVGSQVSGLISKLNVDFNSVVKSNEVIAEIDPSTYEAALEQAKANLANAEANLQLQQIQARRSADLFTNNLVSGSDNDIATATLRQAEASVKIQQAAVSNATANLGYCKVRSPVDGVVISRAVELGQTVASSFSTPTLFQIANDLTKMQIDSSVAEADVGGIVDGQAVDFLVDAYPNRTFHGTVTQVRNSPTTVNNVVTYDCVISVTNADYKLKPGMTANVSVIVAQRENALMIPNSVLRFRPPEEAQMLTNSTATEAPTATNNSSFAGGTGGHHGGGHSHAEHPMFHTVYVLSGTGPDAKLKAVRIKTGISDGISTEVVSGLEEGVPVVTSVALAGSQTAETSNPFGGGFPRRH